MTCSYDLQYRMELANQGMFFDDEEVGAMRARGCSCSAHAHARVPLTLRRQVRKHKAASDNTSGLYVFLSSLPPRRLIVAAKRFARRCARGHRALRYEKMLERARRAKITAVEGSRPGLLRFVPLFCYVPVPVIAAACVSLCSS